MAESITIDPAHTSEEKFPLTDGVTGNKPWHRLSAGGANGAETGMAAGCLILAVVITATCVLVSPRGLVHFDDLTHYLFARWAWRWPSYLLNDWGRPGFTALYFLPAAFGWTACRLLSVVLAAGSAWMAYKIALLLKLRHAGWVLVLVYVQPLFFQLSQTTLTEMPMAFYLTTAVYLALRRRWTLSAAIISLTMITRHEAVIFLPIWIGMAWISGAGIKRLWPILWAPLLVNSLAGLTGVHAPVERLLSPEPSGQYGYGGWLTFFARALHAWGPGVSVLALTGLPSLIRRRGGVLISLCILVYFSAHTIIRALGLFDSGGYARFLVPISPLVSIAALIGWQQLWHEEGAVRRRAIMWAGGMMLLLWMAMERQLVLHELRKVIAAELPKIYEAKWAIRITTIVFTGVTLVALTCVKKKIAWKWEKALLPFAVVAMILLACYALCRPLSVPPEAPLVDKMKQFLSGNGLGDRELISACIWIDYATNRSLPPDRPSVRKQLEEAPLGTLFAWERQFAASEDHKLRLSEFEHCPAFRLIYRSGPLPFHKRPYLIVFEKTGDWHPSSKPET